jgi:hypothetical protein
MRPVLHPDPGVARRDARQGSTCMHLLTAPPLAGASFDRWRRAIAAMPAPQEGRWREPRSAGRP